MITLTTEQAQQIEEALEGVKPLLMGTDTVDKALATIREARLCEARNRSESYVNTITSHNFSINQEPVLCPCRNSCIEDGDCQHNCQLNYTAPQPVRGPVGVVRWFERQSCGLNIEMVCDAELEVDLPEGTKLYANPVRTKDLTDDEIEAAVLSVNTTMEAWITYRAVIAADRDKNK